MFIKFVKNTNINSFVLEGKFKQANRAGVEVE